VLLPDVLNAYYGRVDPALLVWSAINMGADRRQIFRKVVLPSALPLIFAACACRSPCPSIVMFAPR